jgi:hypothetical protein
MWGSLIGGVLGGIFGGGDKEADASNATAQRMGQFGTGLADLYDTNYKPLNAIVANGAMNYDSAENYARAAGDAAATNATEFAKAQSRLTRTPGMDPSSGAYQAGMVGLNLAQAANGAVAQNAARKGVQETAWNRQAQALGLGNALASQATSAMSGAYQAQNNQASNAQRQSDSMGGLIGNVLGSFF